MTKTSFLVQNNVTIPELCEDWLRQPNTNFLNIFTDELFLSLHCLKNCHQLCFMCFLVILGKKYYLAGNSWALEESGGPGPLGDDGGGSQPDRDLAACVEGCVQVVRIVVDVLSDLRDRRRSVWVKYDSAAIQAALQKYCSDSKIIVSRHREFFSKVFSLLNSNSCWIRR